MITKIDWLSFTLPIGEGDIIAPHRLLRTVLETLHSFSPLVFSALTEGFEYEQRKGRAPYSVGFARSDSGCYIFAHPALTHFLVELTGAGCDTLASNRDAREFLFAVAPRLTRIDIASDMLCETNPIPFAEQRDAGRFKSHSEFVSESGITAYVGSRTSNRYARVYRYNPPHERAHLLRAEHVLKAEDAKITAQSILDNGLESVTVALGEAFGWKHASWVPADVTAADLDAWRPERHAGKTLFWLNSAVAPAMIKLAREGKFDATAWLRDNVLSKLTPGQLL